MMIYFVDHIVDLFWITQTFVPVRHSFQNIFVLVRTFSPICIYAISVIGIDNIIEKWLQIMSDLKYEPEFSCSILPGETVFKIFETADNNLMMRILIHNSDLSADPARLPMVCVQTAASYHKVNRLGK